MKYIFFIFLFFVSVHTVYAQKTERFTISGFVRDSLTTENLIGATVYNKSNLAGASTNQYGFYSLTLPSGEIDLIYSYVGYYTKTDSFQLRRDTMININLAAGQYLQEVAITADQMSRIQEKTQMSSINVPVVQIKSLPSIWGDTDVMKVLQMMPGIMAGSEGTSGLHVRGGSPDQNLILLDGVPIFNASHPLGYVSLFNGDAINNIETYKGGFPARYGGRVSSVLDISMKEGNMQKFRGEICYAISGKIIFEGPIVKNRTSFIITGRRTLFDLLYGLVDNYANGKGKDTKTGVVDFVFLSGPGSIKKNNDYFYDLTAKINHKFSDKDRIYLSTYMGGDKFLLISEYKYKLENNSLSISGNDRIQSGLQWGNFMTTFRWNHIFTNRLFSNTTLSFSQYRDHFISKKESKQTYPQDITISDFYELQNHSGIKDWTGKMAFDFIPSPDHYIRFGAGAIYHTYNPGTVSISDTTGNINYGAAKRYAWEYSAYAEDDFRLTERLKANAGLHWSAFHIGDRFYNTLQPRISARYLITPQLSAKASYSRMAQFVHLLSVAFNSIPRDFWVPSTETLRPQQADQIALGLAQNYKEDYEISLEGYYKTLTDVLEYKDGYGLLNMNEKWEQSIVQGTGRSYGMELFVQKKTGAFTGWAGYTLSWTDRHFDELNGGKRFPYKYDRRHDFNIALMQNFGKKKKHEISGSWTFSSGHCMTLPVGIVDAGHPIFHGGSYNTYSYYEYGKRNGYRMKPYHRLDLNIAFVVPFKEGRGLRWGIGLYNAYNRKNPYYVTLERIGGDSYKYVQYSRISILPYFSFQFKF